VVHRLKSGPMAELKDLGTSKACRWERRRASAGLLLLISFAAPFGLVWAQRPGAGKYSSASPPPVLFAEVARQAGVDFVLNNSVTPRKYSSKP